MAGFFVVSVFTVIPLQANAGFLSYISSFFFHSEETAELDIEDEYNSQTMPVLRAALNIDPNPAKGGGDIIIVDDTALLSEAGPSGTLADIEDRPAESDQISIYVVREGDTLSQIAGMFEVSVNTIKWANDIKRSGLITPGRTLVILPVSGVRHTVAKGETLKGITKKYDGDIEEVLKYNDLTTSSVIAVGDVVIVPDGELASPTGSSATKTLSSTGVSYDGYYIKPVRGVRTQGVHGYNAVDIGAPSGTPIVAAASGRVIISRSSGWNGGYGAYIVVKHDNGTQTLYAHNSSNIVYSGDSVVQGQVIGYVGSTGRSTGSHVHFEVRGAKNPF